MSNLAERKANLIKQIDSLKEENAVEILEQTLSLLKDSSKDITDGLSAYQVAELTRLAEEPSGEYLSESEYLKATSQWRIKS